jgi:uncharacterized membrane protein
MSYKNYRLLKAVLVIIVAALVGWAVPQGNPYIPIPAALAAMVIMLLFRRSVKEVIVDERIYSIANRASRITFQVGALIMVLIGATFIALGYGDYPKLGPIGFTLIYSACGILVLYLVSYSIYNRKYGGKSE